MGIWKHTGTFCAPTLEDLSREDCPFCSRNLQHWLVGDEISPDVEVRICRCCGWWSRTERYISPDMDEFNNDPLTLVINDRHSLEGACAQLKTLDTKDISTPLNEIKSYLLAKQAERFTMHPRLFELVVTSVFRDMGYVATATAYSNDGGIDVVLESGDSTLGVQVKRYVDKIEAEQIRSLAGAMILGNHTEGIFVTTSSFRSGAKSAATKLTAKGYPIKLMGGDRFLRQLGIQQIRRMTKARTIEYIEEVLLMGQSTVVYENQ
jgi:restriction system protein